MSAMASQSSAWRLFTQSLIQPQIKENIKAPRHWPLGGDAPVTGEFPAQRASKAENVSIWWRHHAGNIYHFPHGIGRLCTVMLYELCFLYFDMRHTSTSVLVITSANINVTTILLLPHQDHKYMVDKNRWNWTLYKKMIVPSAWFFSYSFIISLWDYWNINGQIW